MHNNTFNVGPSGFNSPFASSNKSPAFSNQGFSNRGFNNQGFNNQGFNNQGFNYQSFNNQGFNKQGFNNQGFTDQGSSYQGSSNQSSSNQGFSNQGFNKQDFSNQGFNNQGFNNQGFNNQRFNNQVFNSQDFNYQDFSNQGSDKQDSSKQGFSHQGFSNQGFNKQGFHNQGFNKPAFGQKRSVFDRTVGRKQEDLSLRHNKENDYRQKRSRSNEQPVQAFERLGYVNSSNKPTLIGHKRQKSVASIGLLDQAINEQPASTIGQQVYVNMFNKPAPKRPVGQAQNNPAPFGQTSSPFGQSTYQLFGQAKQVQPSPYGRSNTTSPFDENTQPSGQAAHAQINPSPIGQTSNAQVTPTPFRQRINKQSLFVQTAQNASLFAQTNIAQTSPAGRTFSQVTQPTDRLNKSTERKKSSTPATAAQVSASKQLEKTPMESMDMVTQLQPKQQKPTKPKEYNNSSLFLTNDPGRRRSTPEKRAQRFGQYQGLYQKLKERRVIERKQAIEDGLIPDPDEQTSLEDAIDFRGTCTLKCPEFEMLERDMQNDLDDLEKDSEGNIDREKAVKKYRRSAAGGEQPLPSDVRTPDALKNTLDYLLNEILAKYKLEKCHKFLRDRTRSIRQDFTLQDIRDISAVHTYERIARFHILSLHEMCEYDEATFSLPQEMEQLNKTLISLMEFYEDLRDEGIEAENEAEFRAYHIICQIKDPGAAQRSMFLPIHIFKDPYMKRALEFHALSQRNNEISETSSRRSKPENIEASQNSYSKFFKLIADPSTPFLMACLLETHFSEVRKGALKAMNASYMMKAGGVQAEEVRQVLAYDNLNQLFKEALQYGIVMDNSLGEPTLRFGQKHYAKQGYVFNEPLSNPSQTKSQLFVEPKKSGRSLQNIVNGVNSLLHQTPDAVNLNPNVPQLAQKKKEEDKSQYYLQIKNQAEFATQRMEEEKKKLEEMVQNNKKVEEEKAALEAEHRRKEDEIRGEMVGRKRAEYKRSMAVQRPQALVKVQEEKSQYKVALEAEHRRKEDEIRKEMMGRKLVKEQEEKTRLAAALEAEHRRKEDEIREEMMHQKQAEYERNLEVQRQQALAKEKEEARLAAALEAEHRRKEEEIQEEMMRQKQAEYERDLEVQRQQALAKEQKEKDIASMRAKELRAQASRKVYNEIMQQVLEEEIKVAVIKNVRRQKMMKKIGLPWLQRARSRIYKRQTKMMQLKENWHFNKYMVTNNPYIPSDDTIYKAVPAHAKPDGIKERTKYSLTAEEIGLENKNIPSTHDAIWAAEDFSYDIYGRIRDKMRCIPQTEYKDLFFKKPKWELLVNAPAFDDDSSSWLHHKFGLDEELHRRAYYYKDFDLGIRMVSEETEIASDTVCQAGGVIFSLPESKFIKTQAEYDQYWVDSKKRLDKLVQSLHNFNPALKVPFLFTYFPEESINTEIAIQEIPTLLGLQSNPLVSDFHVLIMNPNTIVKRLREEIRWISRAPAW